MARSSRHKSHRSHKHRDRLNSEDEGSSKQKVEDEDSAKVSGVSEQAKKISSSKDGIGNSNGEISGYHHGNKRKDKGEDSAIQGDRWNGGGDDDSRVEKESKKEGSDETDLGKGSKSKSLVVDLKGKPSSSRRREGSSERNDDKRKSEKESSKRESSSSQYKDGKEKDSERERERGSERERERESGSVKEKKVQESRYERSDDGASRGEGRPAKQRVEISELQDEMHNHEAEKEFNKRVKRRRDGSGDYDRLDNRDGGERRASSRDGHSKSSSYRDGRYKEKYKEELDRDQRYIDDKRRDEHSSRTYTSERSDSKHNRDDIRVSESRDKKTKDGDRDAICREEYSTKSKDSSGRKRSSDEINNLNDMKSQNAKEPHDDTAKNGSSSSKFDSRSDRARLEYSHPDKMDTSLSGSRTKYSSNASSFTGKDQNRHTSRESTRRDSHYDDTRLRDSLSEDACRSGAVSRDHAIASAGRERATEPRSTEKVKSRDYRSEVFMIDGSSGHHHDRVPRSDTRNSPNQLTERSPSSTSERRSERASARHSLDMEEGGQRNSTSKGGKGVACFQKDHCKERDYLVEKSKEDGRAAQGELLKREHVPVGPSSSCRVGQLQGGSPRHLPPPPIRYGVDSQSVVGSYEDDTRSQSGERKPNTRNRRGGDASVGRGPGTPWKSGPTWPSPVPNGFLPPLQHGHPSGFHPGLPQFPAPPLFGIRPSLDLNNPSYHIHEAGNRFSGHARPYGWRNPVEDCPPHLQVWDGNTHMFGDESRIYGRQEWDPNRHLMSNRGWEMNTDMWNGPNGNPNMEFPVHQKAHEYPQKTLTDEAWIGQFLQNAHDERARSEQPVADSRSEQHVADSTGIKLPTDASPEKLVEPPSKPVLEKIPEPSKTRNGTFSEKQRDGNFCYHRTYLSRLDISHDLVHPELYKQFMSLVEAKDRETGYPSSCCQKKNNVEGFRFVAKSQQYACGRVFPTAADATFEKAMSLYEKQKDGMKQMMHSPSYMLCLEHNNPPETADGGKMNSESANSTGEGLLLKNVADDCIDEDVKLADNNTEVEHQQPLDNSDKPSNMSHDTKAQLEHSSCDAVEKVGMEISDAVISVMGTKESEAIIPECRVNLSRIHPSPESTH